jgi:hypothetical protein
MEIAFLIVCCGSIFLTPFFISGKCTRITYIINIIIVNILEVFLILSVFSGLQFRIMGNLIYMYFDVFFLFYIFAYVYNNIITVIRCNACGLKRYNFIMPVFQFIKFLLFNVIVVFGIESRDIWKPLIVLINLTNIIQIIYLYKNNENTNNTN